MEEVHYHLARGCQRPLATDDEGAGEGQNLLRVIDQVSSSLSGILAEIGHSHFKLGHCPNGQVDLTKTQNAARAEYDRKAALGAPRSGA